MSIEDDNFYTIKEVADKFKVSDLTIRRWIYSGKLNAARVGKQIRISEDDLAEFVERA